MRPALAISTDWPGKGPAQSGSRRKRNIPQRPLGHRATISGKVLQVSAIPYPEVSNMSQAAPKTLAEISADGRQKLRPVKVYGDALKAGYADLERRRIFGLAFTAASLAAAERKRHGRESTPEEKSDAAQDALVAAYSEGTPTLADLVDPDRSTVATFDGSRESLRPCGAMIAAAGASLDAAHSGRALLDPEAGTAGLLAASAQSRDAGEARRSVAAQLVDPAISPLPAPVAEAMTYAGIWPDDPVRQAICDYLAPDLTAADWSEAGEKGSAAAITKRRQRGGKLALDVDPKAKAFADRLTAWLETRTDAERAEAEARAAARLIEANPDGPRSEAAKLPDTAWRMTQPYVHPVKVSTLPADGDA